MGFHERQRHVLQWLRDRRHPAAWLAGELGVSVRTVYRDVSRLRREGYDIGSARGPHGGYWLNAGASLPVRFSADDVQTLAVCLAGVDGDLIQKLVTALPKASRESLLSALAHVDASYVADDPERLRLAARGCSENRAVLLYYTGADGAPQAHRVAPRSVELRPDGAWLYGQDGETAKNHWFPLRSAKSVKLLWQYAYWGRQRFPGRKVLDSAPKWVGPRQNVAASHPLPMRTSPPVWHGP